MNTKSLGILLLWLGFLSGSLATVWNAPAKGVKFSRDLMEKKDKGEAKQDGDEQKEPSDGKDAKKTGEQEAEKDDKQAAKPAAKDDGKKQETNSDKQEPEIAKDGWHLINWVWYGVSVAVSVGGIVLIRVGLLESAKKSEKTEASLEEIKSSLRQLVFNVQRLEKDSKELPPSQILARIDDDLADDLRIFADGRESITAEFGLTLYADVMTHFASGERSVNRAWSAAADGYVNEAETCLERASQMFARAEKELESA